MLYYYLAPLSLEISFFFEFSAPRLRGLSIWFAMELGVTGKAIFPGLKCCPKRRIPTLCVRVVSTAPWRRAFVKT